MGFNSGFKGLKLQRQSARLETLLYITSKDEAETPEAFESVDGCGRGQCLMVQSQLIFCDSGALKEKRSDVLRIRAELLSLGKHPYVSETRDGSCAMLQKLIFPFITYKKNTKS